MDLIERRTLLRGALVLPAAATPLILTAPEPQRPPEPRRTQRIRTWQVETLDRRVNPR
jgi:hypothetical protein